MATGEVGEVRWCVVTGGRGFAARHLVEMLLRSDQWRVRIVDLSPSIRLEPHEEEEGGGVLGRSLRSGKALYVTADLRDKNQVVQAFQGAEVVFHMAAPDSSINNYELHYSVNVKGTKNVIDACVECKVKRLIYTSSPSVVFDGVHGLHNVDESTPYPEKFNDSYSETKAEGEKLVLKANGQGGLLTCCIRPSSIFGPGDKLLVPSLVAAAKAGKSKFIIGDGSNMYDFTYVENVAHGHVCAEKALAAEEHGSKAAGQAYFITNTEPIKFWDFISKIVGDLGYESPRTKIPVPVIMPIAHVVEWTYKTFARYGMRVPQLTPSRVRLLSCDRTFDCSKAQNQLGYEPIVSLQEGLQRTIDSYAHLQATRHMKTTSKASDFLGNGRVADTLLWKDKRKSLTTILLMAILYYYFYVSGDMCLTSVAKILLAIALFLFIHSKLPAKVFSYRIKRIPPHCFHLSDEMAHRMVLSMCSEWNSLARLFKSIGSGNDWTRFLKVVGALMIINLVGILSIRRSIEIGIPLIFIAVYGYDKWEEKIDSLFVESLSFLSRLKVEAVKMIQKQ
ncbi:3beta-hydroxysteroid-dehydrogenase/decarboxylase [Wolffia australiana]